MHVQAERTAVDLRDAKEDEFEELLAQRTVVERGACGVEAAERLGNVLGYSTRWNFLVMAVLP
jgi:hypothetical protein